MTSIISIVDPDPNLLSNLLFNILCEVAAIICHLLRVELAAICILEQTVSFSSPVCCRCLCSPAIWRRYDLQSACPRTWSVVCRDQSCSLREE